MTVEDGSGPADGVVVISTGLANVGSVVNMCRRLGVDPLVTGDPSVVESAALGFSQMRRIDQILLDRRTTAGRYDEALAHLHGVRVPGASPGTTWSYQSYVVVLDDGIDREDVIAEMADGDVETTIGTYACHQHPAFSEWGMRRDDLPNSARFADRALTLPVVPRMTVSQVDRVVETLAAVIGSS